jgi:hypothetical protein
MVYAGLSEQTGFLYSISASARGQADIFEIFVVEPPLRPQKSTRMPARAGGRSEAIVWTVSFAL